MCNAKKQTSFETESLIRKKIHIIPNSIHHSTRPFLKYNNSHSREQTYTLFKQKQSSMLFPVPACDVLAIPHSETLAPSHLSHRKFPGHISLPQQAPASHHWPLSWKDTFISNFLPIVLLLVLSSCITNTFLDLCIK